MSLMSQLLHRGSPAT
uniref:Uncharacterized protein n=1 Tax=Rhizophora mucronata TaxID=61149 RepID=A0A2P2MPM6_RHIMU